MTEKHEARDEAYAKALRRIEKCRDSRGKDLRLNGLGLRTLPPEIGQLTALTNLYLVQNQLSTLPPEIGQLTDLTMLDLYRNQLSTLPPEIGQLTALTTLDLYGNQLSTLPPEIGQFTALTKLFLHCNQLSALPPEIGQLTALQRLVLHNNQLGTLPAEIGQLARLEHLTLERNALWELPESLRQLRSLKQLTLHGNEALGLPGELLGPTWIQSVGGTNLPADPRAILDYYFSRQIEGEEPMREVRLLLVGRGRVGKTSLLKALRDESPDENEPETPGINVIPLELECPQGTATGHVWDFGGQEFLHGTHQIFLAERCVYLLVLDGRESNWETETDYWLRFIQSFGGASPIIVVLTKYDQHPFSIDRFRLQERCPQIAGFVEADAFTGRGIEGLTTRLEQTVDGMKDVWLPLPKKWHKVKETLTQMPQNFLEYREYQTLCRDTGVDDAGKQDSLAQTLHRLGIALNFRHHHRLRDTSVLKPEWVTEAIYGLIRYVQKQDSHGVMQLPWMAEALDATEYPADKHAFVLELMEKFDVAFALEGTQSWLIPELLREEQPEAFEEFRGRGVRRLRFSYPDALPPGLLPRFIVRTHEMSGDHPDWRWRSGVVLEWQGATKSPFAPRKGALSRSERRLSGARALVRLNRMERRTEVAVIESPPNDDDRQSLFDLIRAHLTVLHGKVRVVEEAEMEGHPDSWVRVGKLRKLEEKGTLEVDEETREGDLATVKVTETLDGVESPQAREADRPSAPPRMRLFVSYAHDDAKQIAPLSKHLTILGQRGYIQTWQDTQLVAGEDWKDRIMEELGRADIVLLLYSTASRASKFIQTVEVPEALRRAKIAKSTVAAIRAKSDDCTLIVVPLDRKDWDENVELERDLKTFMTATWNAKPVLEYTPHRKGWQEVEHSIREAVELQRASKR